MFGPEYTAGCPSCSAIADGFDGFVVHLANHDVTLCGSVAGAAREAAGVQAADGLELPLGVVVWKRLQLRLSGGVHQGAAASGVIEYNFTRARWTCGRRRRMAKNPLAEIAAMAGTDVATYTRETPGMSAFVLEDGLVYHTYSAYARGLDGLWGMYQWLDRAPRGATRRASGAAATTSTTRAEPSHGYRGATAGLEISRRMSSDRASQQAFFGVSALLFAARAAVAIVWCTSMAAMGEMPMPGGWTMSMPAPPGDTACASASTAATAVPAWWRSSSSFTDLRAMAVVAAAITVERPRTGR